MRLGSVGVVVGILGVASVGFAQHEPNDANPLDRIDGVVEPDPVVAPAPAPVPRRPPPPRRPTPNPPSRYRAPPPSGPTVIDDWDPEQPPPEGYVLRSAPHKGMLGGGIALLTIGWVSSIVVGAVASAEEDERGLDGDGVEASDWYPLFIPVAGPIVAIGSVDADPAGMVPLIADAVVQIAGLALTLAGGLVTKHRAVRLPPSFAIAPIVTPNLRGVGLGGAF